MGLPPDVRERSTGIASPRSVHGKAFRRPLAGRRRRGWPIDIDVGTDQRRRPAQKLVEATPLPRRANSRGR
jgi:hypothetical protein